MLLNVWLLKAKTHFKKQTLEQDSFQCVHLVNTPHLKNPRINPDWGLIPKDPDIICTFVDFRNKFIHTTKQENLQKVLQTQRCFQIIKMLKITLNVTNVCD